MRHSSVLRRLVTRGERGDNLVRTRERGSGRKKRKRAAFVKGTVREAEKKIALQQSYIR